ncbi:DUF3137 domain-containing protein [uncultured Finegoldia sp.]|uniref:DUF3137 domain-containing protein n=1 Tax=uncultured Finegoldia sp. TaxID=328009 RepID=UPI00261AFD38|nr:DUF3137 domain-containing protein [uncultured Finegoldia sp.]
MKSRDKFLDSSIVDELNRIENLPETKNKLKSILNKNSNKNMENFSVGFLGFVASTIAARFFSGYFLYIILILIWLPFFNFFSRNKYNSEDTYIKNFLEPVLKKVLPDTEVDYDEEMDLDILGNLVYNSKIYESKCHITFGDEYKTQFCNLYAYHEKFNDKGKEVRYTDFQGQVLASCFNTGINGHIRVVPVCNKSMGSVSYGPYGNKRKDEKEILTESIEFNNSYSIFSTDDYYARLIIDAKVIDFLNEIKNKMRVSIYMSEKFVAMAFETNNTLFKPPLFFISVDKLALAGNYEKIRTNLSQFYTIMDNFVDNF